MGGESLVFAQLTAAASSLAISQHWLSSGQLTLLSQALNYYAVFLGSISMMSFVAAKIAKYL